MPSSNVVPLARLEHPEAFFENYFVAKKPVVVTGAARGMPAFKRWSDEYLVEQFGSLRPKVRLGNGRFGEMNMADYLAYLSDPSDYESSVGLAYLTDFFLKPSFGDSGRATLGSDAVFPMNRGGDVAEFVSIYAGPTGSKTAMHQDVFSMHTWLANLRGDKAWRLCAPADLDDATARSFDAFAPQTHCTVYEAVLAAGDLIYLPPDWWHQVQNLTSTLAISGNFCTLPEAHAAYSESKRYTDPELHRRWTRVWAEILGDTAPTA